MMLPQVFGFPKSLFAFSHSVAASLALRLTSMSLFGAPSISICPILSIPTPSTKGLCLVHVERGTFRVGTSDFELRVPQRKQARFARKVKPPPRPARNKKCESTSRKRNDHLSSANVARSCPALDVSLFSSCSMPGIYHEASFRDIGSPKKLVGW